MPGIVIFYSLFWVETKVLSLKQTIQLFVCVGSIEDEYNCWIGFNRNKSLLMIFLYRLSMETNDFIDLCMQAYFALIQVFAHNISRQRDLIQTVIEDFCILLDEV